MHSRNDLRFSKDIPENFHGTCAVISGPESYDLPYKDFLLREFDHSITEIFEIRYLTSGGPYKQGLFFHSFLAVGHFQYFYLYDLTNRFNRVRMEMRGYFGHCYIYDDKLYVTDAGSVYCINKEGKEMWRQTNLAIDGVLLGNFTANEIHGSAQSDPPDGWTDFILDRSTGLQLK